MNKKYIILSLILLLFLTACNSKDLGDKMTRAEELDFQVEKIQMTKSFQNIRPYAEIKNKDPRKQEDGKIQILISAGLTESSGLEIDRVVKKQDQVEIHISSQFDGEKVLAVPQSIILVDSKDLNLKENLSLLVKNHDEELIDLKISMDEALNKLQSNFKLTTLVKPTINLVKNNDQMFWNIFYQAVFDKSEEDFPLISFEALVDSSTGEISKTNSQTVARSIDRGNIVNYQQDKLILYKKINPGKEALENMEELWSYNIEKDNSTLLFKSENNIVNTQLSQGLEYISFIENKKGSNNLYIIPKTSDNAYRVSLVEDINPVLSAWVGTELYLVENSKGRSQIYKYWPKEDRIEKIKKLDYEIEKFAYEDGYFLFGRPREESLNKEIYLSKNFEDIKIIGEGFNVRLDSDRVFYLEDIEDSEDNRLRLYNLTSHKTQDIYRGIIPSFQIINSRSLVYPMKKNTENIYALYRQNIGAKDNKELSISITPKAYYNSRKNIFYININSPLDKEKNMLIYSVDME